MSGHLPPHADERPPDESRVHPVGRCRVSSRKWLSDFVPKGLSDGSQAIYCLVSVQKREPSRRARNDWVRQACDEQADNQPWVRIKPCPTGRIPHSTCSLPPTPYLPSYCP